MNPEEVMQKYEKYINPSSTRLFRFMGLSSVEARAEGWIYHRYRRYSVH